MLSRLFLGMSLMGAEWVLYLLVFLSIVSLALILERFQFYRKASQGLEEFRDRFRKLVQEKKWDEASLLASDRAKHQTRTGPDLETEMALALAGIAKSGSPGEFSPEVLAELAEDAVLRARLAWDKNLAVLATIGNNAPFIGLFGTVLGIIQAFHDLSQQTLTGAQTVTAGISEALVATAVGLLVAIPAVAAFNFFQRRVKANLTSAEAMKSFLVGKLAK